MEINMHKQNLLKLQNSIYSKIIVNDVSVEIVEIVFDEPGNASFCPVHTHTWFEFNYITSGKILTIISNKTFEINAGEFFLVPPNTEHSHKYNNKSPHEGICMRWIFRENSSKPETLGIYTLLKSLNTWKVGVVKDCYFVFDLFTMMLKEADRSISPVTIQLLIMSIITKLAKINSPENSEIDADYNINKRIIIKKVELYLNDNFYFDLNVHKIAASMHMSYGFLARLYKRLTGRTMMDKLMEIRLEKAVDFLKNSEHSIQEISQNIGFSNQYYFSKVFKDKYGICPREYRKLNFPT